jgi:hypothetical protein
MSLRNPLGRNQRDWGNYASLNACPKAAGTAVAINKTDGVLEVGDTAYVTGSGPCHCTSAGTAGVNDATWALTGGSGATPSVRIATSGSTIATNGTNAVSVGAVWLTNGAVVLATSNALVGALVAGTATLQVRRQTTGVLVAGLAWSTAAALNNQTLAGAVNIVADDWYVFEIVSTDAAGTALVLGVTLNF